MFSRSRLPPKLWQEIVESAAATTPSGIIKTKPIGTDITQFRDVPRLIEAQHSTMGYTAVVRLESACGDNADVPSILGESQVIMSHRWRSDVVFPHVDLLLDATHQTATQLTDTFEHPADKGDTEFDGVVCFFEVTPRYTQVSAQNWSLSVAINRTITGQATSDQLAEASFSREATSGKAFWPFPTAGDETISSAMMTHTAEGESAAIKVSIRTITTKIDDNTTRCFIQIVDVFAQLAPQIIFLPHRD